jgi:hypothetical protein
MPTIKMPWLQILAEKELLETITLNLKIMDDELFYKVTTFEPNEIKDIDYKIELLSSIVAS